VWLGHYKGKREEQEARNAELLTKATHNIQHPCFLFCDDIFLRPKGGWYQMALPRSIFIYRLAF
jgi:hypothetical protein